MIDINSKEFLDKLVATVPSKKQLAWHDIEYYNFIHFGMNTMVGVEWGDGKADPAKFNPKQVDTDQWVRTCKASGAKGVILTAKHHDGFCLFPSDYTDYTVASSPYKQDIVAQFVESCKKYDMKAGLYLSPWDRNNPLYGTPEYNDFFINQLTEICTRYGELFALWFDGACGEGSNGKKQVYDFPRYLAKCEELQPNAVTCILGKDVRWIGNEAGKSRKSEWSVVPRRLLVETELSLEHSGSASHAGLDKEMNTELPDIGSREFMAKNNVDEFCWFPAEADTSITHGWFYAKWREIFMLKSLRKLSKIYYDTVGKNSALLLNIPPNKEGVIAPKTARRLIDFGNKIKSDLKNVVPAEISQDGETYTAKLEHSAKVKRIVLQEDVEKSQRVEGFELYAVTGGEEKLIYTGTVIGWKRICTLPRTVQVEQIKLKITACRHESYVRTLDVVE